MTSTTAFLLNDRIVEADAPDGMLLLDYLRKDERLVGTKEGCKEGDCGACAVVIGELDDEGDVDYELVTSCLVPLGEMHGKHVVTIEGMNVGDGLNPVQQAMCDRGGTQCGFCTPGFVVSMVWYLMCGEGEPTLDGFQRAIGGNLCRCTGYASINRASEDLIEKFSEGGEWRDIWTADDRIAALADAGMIPSYLPEAPDKLAEISQPEAPDGEIDVADYFVAGGTDIYVQEGEELPKARIAVLNHFPYMEGVRHEDGEFRCGALTSFEDFGQHPDVRELIPDIDHALFLIASLHLRNRATLGGNIVNASPIGDMTALLYALGSDLVLERFEPDQDGLAPGEGADQQLERDRPRSRGPDQDGLAPGEGADQQLERDRPRSRTRRVVPMEDFYEGYKQMDLRDDELLTEIVFPDGDSGTKVNFEKVSKRKALDIASVCSGSRLSLEDDQLVEASITMGGVAPVPFLLEETRDFLLGRPVSNATVEGAIDVAMGEISPIGDIRGSADYKRLLVRQLMIAHFTESYPSRVQFEALAS